VSGRGTIPFKDLCAITDELIADISRLRFGPPVTHVYNPLVYARRAYDTYLRRYGSTPKEVVLVGMNPGPWGMAQTGVPFGEVDAVKNWLKIETRIGAPDIIHPQKPVDGFACPKSEVSGRRLWGWIRTTFDRPGNFFRRFLVINYCPLLFLEAGGRNRTPVNLRAAEKKPLFEVCDRGLRRMVAQLDPCFVVGVGTFARDRARQALGEMGTVVGGITHPSPANPRANRGWEKIVARELVSIGVRIGAQN
jgi:single-strand selective monofunctional uracil DNA glycosylase